MSLITRCPACRTMFKVVPDQLRISGGWVRCGQCDEVFDASSHLQDPQLAEAQPPEPVDIELEMPEAPADETTVLDEPQASVDVALTPLEPVLDETPAWESASFFQSEAETNAVTEAAFGPGLPPESAELPAPSFMREVDDRATFAAHSWWRFGGLLAASLLGLALLVQLLTYERDRIAATAPGFKPVLEAVCAWMQCSVAPLRQIESVLIDSASFNKLRADVYRLNLTLKNTAATAVALPALELSLTDAQDQALIRRVFLVGELDVPSEVLAAGSESAVSLTLAIKTNGNAERIAGYRVLAFYP